MISEHAPITIVQVGNFRHPWCSEVHFALSLEALGHSVVRLQEDTTKWVKIPGIVDGCGAQMLMWTKTWPASMDEVLPELARLRESGVPTVSYHLDRWYGLNREHQVLEHPFFHTDLVVSPDDSPGWARDGVNHLWLPPGVYAGECGVVAPNPRRWPHEVVFIGSYPYPHPEHAPARQQLVEAMQAAFGDRFGVYPRGKPVRNAALQELYATAKVVVGDSCTAGEVHGYWSDRIPETLGRGGVLVHQHTDRLTDWYQPGIDLITYEERVVDEAVTLVDWLLADDDRRLDLSVHGRETVLARDTYAHRMATLIDHVDATLGMRPPPARRGPPRSRPAPPRREAVPRQPRERPAARTARASGGVMPHPTMSARHRYSREIGRFVTVGGPSAEMAVREVWDRDDYGLRPEHVKGKRVVDIGGNCGAFTVLAAKLGAASVHVWEPHPESRAALEVNLRHNRIGSGVVTVHGEAVGHACDQVLLAGQGGGACVLPSDAASELDGQMVVMVDANVALADCDFLKMDCEGSEWAILATATDATISRLERIVMEFHGPKMGPHLAWLGDDDWETDWRDAVFRLASLGHLEIHGRPEVGGLMSWRRF